MTLIGKRLLGVASISILFLLVFSSMPAEAILEGSNRDRMEFLDFSERMIKNGLYANSGRNTFSQTKRKYVRGVKRHNEPHIYEPDVYTWELAMEKHRKKLEAMAPQEPVLMEGHVQPQSMVQGNEFALPSTYTDRPAPAFDANLPIIPPTAQGARMQSGYYVQPYVEQAVTPSGQPYTIQSSPTMPPNSQAIMQGMTNRANVRGIYHTDPLRGQIIQEKVRKRRR